MTSIKELESSIDPMYRGALARNASIMADIRLRLGIASFSSAQYIEALPYTLGLSNFLTPLDKLFDRVKTRTFFTLSKHEV